ncbi:MAG TPA: GNAT family N-acetyltransferase [Nocardioidaceae bacterium]|nr:GNAT family N-acetyltransferase [Nocardioidaceae bacterium]
MSRSPVQVRDAVPSDAAALMTVWGDFRRTSAERSGGQTPEVEAANAVARIAADPDQRLLVGVLDGKVVGAAHLLRGGISPIHSETAIHVTHLHVLGGHRRHGVGKALVEAAVTWAEEKDTTHLLAAASVHSRDANRFMARLGLTQIAVVRGASVPALRAKLPVEPPPGARVSSRNHRSVGAVLAQRRQQRRAQAKDS